MATDDRDTPLSRWKVPLSMARRPFLSRLAALPYVMLLIPALVFWTDLEGRPTPASEYVQSGAAVVVGALIIYFARLWPFRRRHREVAQTHAAAVYHVRLEHDPPYYIAICECDWTSRIEATSTPAFEHARAHTPTVDRTIQLRP